MISWELIKTKLKSQSLWIAVLALSYLHVAKLGYGIDSENLQHFVDTVMELCVLFGIAHNPDKTK